MKNNIKYAGMALLLVIIIGAIYSIFFKPVSAGGNNSLLLAGAALVLGASIMFLINKAFFRQEKKEIRESSHTIVESMRKVFKIVTAEGHFNEIYNYEESSKLFGFIPTHKKALVIVTAKALIGYDFEKCTWELDEDNRKVRLKHFPQPEILSLDTDYRYYNIEENLLNKFSREDLARIQSNGKKQVMEAAKKSDLPKIAAEQMRTLLTEIIYSKNWKIENLDMVNDYRLLQQPGKQVSEEEKNQ